MNNIKLRIVDENDAEFLFRIMNDATVLKALNEVETHLCDWEDAIREWNIDEDEEDYMIYNEGVPIGWLGINGLISTDRIAYLKIVAILPDYQNRGIGHYSISHIVEMLRLRNYTKVALYTNQNNHKAQDCYRKCGFKVVEELTEEMSDGEIVARYKMELNL